VIEQLLQHWERLKHVLQPALSREGDLFSLDDVWQAVQNEQAQFWPGRNSAVVTEIKVYPRSKVLHVWLAAGDLDEIRGMVHMIKHFGRSVGCERIALQGRPGWSRVFGIKPTSVTLQEKL
jgi:hypothetical protein